MPFFENEGCINIDLNDIEMDLLNKLPLMKENQLDFLNAIVKISVKEFIDHLVKHLFDAYEFNQISQEELDKKIEILRQCKDEKITPIMKKVKEML